MVYYKLLKPAMEIRFVSQELYFISQNCTCLTIQRPDMA